LSSTLTVWVDGVRWTQVDALPTAGADDHVYVVRATDAGTVVQFGDGVTGARLPSGAANVTAVYRSGAGLAGRVRAGQLSLPVSRAGGVSAVSNPAPSIGGDDPETADSARVSAPLRVTTLDRIVSMDDYALYARAFPGVAKAQAVWARAGRHRGVLLTVAGDSGTVLVAQQGVGASLLGALRTYGDRLVPVSLAPYVPRSFRFAATVRTDADRVRSDVLADASARLAAAFSFSARDLGQPVSASDVLSVIQATPGVVAATITAMWVFDPSSAEADVASGPPATALGVQLLPAAAPSPGADIGTLVGAELIVLDSAPITWGVLP
jgi:predicted phage baseplate assembly protein